MQDDRSRIEAEHALARILADDKFACAPQMSAFLAYVVRQTLDGRAERIKAYTIGIEALGKPESFDPQTDPSVRVLAKRLRTCLTGYHERHPEASPVIEIRPGCYRPLFLVATAGQDSLGEPALSWAAGSLDATMNSIAAAPDGGARPKEETPPARGALSARARPALPTVRVSDAYLPGSSGAALAAVAAGVLARAEGLQVIRHAREESTTWPEDYALLLEAIEVGEEMRVELQLVRSADGLVVHGSTCRVDPGRDDPDHVQGRLSGAAIEAVERFATDLAERDGTLLRDYRVRLEGTTEALRRTPERLRALDAA